jgi:hypothetical protein
MDERARNIVRIINEIHVKREWNNLAFTLKTDKKIRLIIYMKVFCAPSHNDELRLIVIIIWQRFSINHQFFSKG